MAGLKGWAFPVEVDEASGRIKMTEDNENVRQSVRLILQTDKGERKMRPNFGTGMNQFMFANVDLRLVKSMSDAIAQSIRLWESHVMGVTVAVQQSQDNNAAVQVDIQYITDISPTQVDAITEEMDLSRMAH